MKVQGDAEDAATTTAAATTTTATALATTATPKKVATSKKLSRLAERMAESLKGASSRR
jgi:hypothetical protein